MYISCEVSYLRFCWAFSAGSVVLCRTATAACALFMPTSVPAQGAMLKAERTRTVAFQMAGILVMARS